MKLNRVSKAVDGKHKFVAEFMLDNGRTKKTKFGALGMDDYTLTGDTEQRDRYRTRHAKDLRTHDPTRAGYLSYWLLWGDSVNLQTNIRAYRSRFNL